MDQTIFIGSIREYLELDKKKNRNPDKYKKIEIIYDIDNFRKERGNMTDQNKDEKRFNEEEKKVNAYIEKHPKISYREAVLACLDKTEKPVEDQEKKEKYEAYIQKQKEDTEKVEEYIEKHPGTEYREAVLTVLGKDELTENEKKVEEYIDNHEGCTYREAVLAVLDTTEEPKKEE